MFIFSKFHEKSLLHQQKQKHEKRSMKTAQKKKLLWGRRKRMEATLIVPIKLFGLEIVHWILSMLYLLLLYCPFSYECTFRLFFFYYFMNIAKSSSTSNRLIKHLIKYRYKSNIFFYFHKFFSIIFVIKKNPPHRRHLCYIQFVVCVWLCFVYWPWISV